MISSTPEGNEVPQRDGKVVARVSVDSLEQAKDNPDVAESRALY